MSGVVICSKCKQDINGCTCEQFHPNEVLISEAEPLRLTFGGDTKKFLIVNQEEASELYNFFLTCGYISYETHAKIHEFIDGKLAPFIKDTEQ